MLETRPGLLRKVALLSKALGIVLLIVGVIGLIAGLSAGGNMPAIVTTLVKLASLWILITGVFFFIILYAVGDMVLILLGLEERTRAMREQVARSAAQSGGSSGGRTGGQAGPSAAARPTSTSSPSRSASAGSSSSSGSSTSASATKEASSSGEEKKSSEEDEEVLRRATEQAKRAAEIAQKAKREGSERK